MATDEEKMRRKRLRRAIEEKQKAAEIARMPLSRVDLASLLEHVGAMYEAHGCDHSVRHTRGFLMNAGLSPDAILPWLREYGGYCDCEVVANVGERWERE